MVTDKIKESNIRAALNTARVLRDTAERLEAAAAKRDFAKLSEISLTLGAALKSMLSEATLPTALTSRSTRR